MPMPPRRPTGHRRNHLIAACAVAAGAVALGCAGASMGDAGHAGAEAALRLSGGAGQKCSPLGAVKGGGYNNKYRCDGKRNTPASWKWVIIQWGAGPYHPGLLPDGVFTCARTGDHQIPVTYTIRGDIYTKAPQSSTVKRPHQPYRAGEHSAPHGGMALAMQDGAGLAVWAEYVPATAGSAVDGKDTLWIGPKHTWPSDVKVCTKPAK